MTTEKLPCLINESDCARIAGNPVCPKCVMDERVVYPGVADREAAETAGKARYWKAAVLQERVAREEKERLDRQKAKAEEAKRQAQDEKEARQRQSELAAEQARQVQAAKVELERQKQESLSAQAVSEEAKAKEEQVQNKKAKQRQWIGIGIFMVVVAGINTWRQVQKEEEKRLQQFKEMVAKQGGPTNIQELQAALGYPIEANTVPAPLTQASTQKPVEMRVSNVTQSNEREPLLIYPESVTPSQIANIRSDLLKQNLVASDEILKLYPHIIFLIAKDASLTNVKKQSYLDLMPTMTDIQLDRLYAILEGERLKLER